MRGVNVFKIILIVLLPLLVASVLLWYLQEEKAFNIYILDKTVAEEERTEHKGFNWLLTYYDFRKKDHKLYNYKEDYYGFFPINTSGNNKEFKRRSIRLYEVLSIADELDMVYYTDTYGVTYQDWYNRLPDRMHSPLIYGGLNQNDYLLLSEMRRKNKLIITEFNMLGSPTSDLIRQKTETLFDFCWSGWTGCYFKSLHTSNPSLPGWIVALYEKKFNKKWDFGGAGIILIQESGNIIVLENTKHLNKAFPQIVVSEYGQKKYRLPETQNYLFWFDIIKAGKTNKVIANYQLSVNSDGKALLDKHDLSLEFPAIIEHLDHYKFYYFAGDFSDRNIFMLGAYFKGLPSIAKALYWRNSDSKKAFYWRFYFPLIYNILEKNLLTGEKSVDKN